jgi:uncharacterized protein (TIGR02266 family)
MRAVSLVVERIERYRELEEKSERGELTSDEENELEAITNWLEAFWARDSIPPASLRNTLQDWPPASAPRDSQPSSTRRESLRVPSRLEVRFVDAHKFERAYLRNISEGGVYVATDRDLRMGDRFRVTLVIEEPKQELDLAVEVVWVNKNPSEESGVDPGVGVCWLEPSPEQKLAIKAVIRHALDAVARQNKGS